MPCDQVRTQQVDWQKADAVTLVAALGADGWTITLGNGVMTARKSGAKAEFGAGKLTTENIEPNAVRRLYAEQTIRTVTQRYGWRQEARGSKRVLTKAW